MIVQDFPIPIGLAPMDGVTDLPVRLWLALSSRQDFAITPFLRLTPDYPLQRIPSTFCPDDGDPLLPPVRPQLMGSCPKTLARFAKHLLTQHRIVDLNFGCPAPRVVGNRAGSALIEDKSVLWAFLGELFEDMPPERISLKTRLGFFQPDEATAILEILRKFPLHSLSLHGRTREQRYRGTANWTAIDDVARSSPFPVIASGDVVSSEHFLRFRAECPHAKALLIGRGLLRNPWLLWEIREQQKVTLSSVTLVAALNVACLLFHATRVSPPARVVTALRESLENRGDGRDVGLWLQTIESLTARDLAPKDVGQVHPSCIARLKMLWNYLRTGLEAQWDDSNLLRSKTVEEFFALLEVKALSIDTVPIGHRPDWDWRFSGEPKPERGPP